MLQGLTGLIEQKKAEKAGNRYCQQEQYGAENQRVGSRGFESYGEMQTPVDQLDKLSEKHRYDGKDKFEDMKNKNGDEFYNIQQNDSETFEVIHALKYNPPL